MKELPVLFTKDNRAKVIAGDKTQTRRTTGLEYVNSKEYDFEFHGFSNEEDALYAEFHATSADDGGNFKAKYRKGDHLWLLEPYQILRTWYNKQAVEGVYINNDPTQVDDPFNADGKAILLTDAEWKRYSKRKWPHRSTSARFMYKSLARYRFEVLGVGCERVQDISEADAIAEGIGKHWDGSKMWYENYLGNCDFIDHDGISGAIASFSSLWDSIYKDRGHGGDKNPWVFKYVFEKIVNEN